MTVGIIAIAVWGKHIFTGTPRYSLSQLQQAISEKDTSEIEKYLDTEAIATQIVDVSLASAQQQAVAKNDIFGILGNSLGLVEMMRPQMEAQIEKFISQGLEQIPETDSQKLKLESIERNDDDAVATFDLSELAGDENSPLKSISFKMEQQSDRQWQIRGFSKESLSEIAKFMDSH